MGLRARITASGESIRRRRPVADIGNCITVREVGNVGQGKFVFVVQKKVTTVKRAISDNAACDVPKESDIVDIDGADVGNPLAVVEYVEEMYKFYKLSESRSIHQVHGYMELQHEIIEQFRMVVVDWLIAVHMEFQLTPEVLYLSVQILDRYLALNLGVGKEELQLVDYCHVYSKQI
ncbi:G2/mitotic-specific cyclin-2-like [Papaver somniferum]|uniref:G2/mitotic-specific cyclin-2-like n=1 Tax=Papaver somniferum TaxID=3469 RepID=UPI000E6F86A4|nr:G2/mitotic-specific cyclin-2-like [Papaver somniferum]